MPSEFEVYQSVVALLVAHDWRVVCASPPTGTDPRFRKCLIPRRTVGAEASQRGFRDEVDVTAARGDTILLIENKLSLKDSFSIRNALGESDLEKLKRIVAAQSAAALAKLLARAHGNQLPTARTVLPVLAVGILDAPLPDDMSVLLVGAERAQLRPAGPGSTELTELARSLK